MACQRSRSRNVGVVKTFDFIRDWRDAFYELTCQGSTGSRASANPTPLSARAGTQSELHNGAASILGVPPIYLAGRARWTKVKDGVIPDGAKLKAA